MPNTNPSDFDIIQADYDQETHYLVFEGDDNPSTIIAFFPTGERETVLVTSPGFEVLDRGEERHLRDQDRGEWLSSHFTEDDAARAVHEARVEHDLTRATAYGYVLEESEDQEPRFVIDSLEWMDCPGWFSEYPVEIGYHRSDGWRGYTTFTAPEGWTILTSGWVTGFPDESTARKIDAAEVHNALYQGDITPPVPMIWCFGITSNVFSQTSDVMVPEGSEGLVNEWLDGLDMTTAEDFDNAFS